MLGNEQSWGADVGEDTFPLEYHMARLPAPCLPNLFSHSNQSDFFFNVNQNMSPPA